MKTDVNEYLDAHPEVKPARTRDEIFKANNERISVKAAASREARRRIEDFKLAREMGISIEDLITRRRPNCGYPNTRSKAAKYCSDKCRKQAYDKKRKDR